MKRKIIAIIVSMAVAVSFVPAAAFAATASPVKISAKKASLSHYVYVYNGTERKPSVTIKGLRKNRDFKVTYTDNVAVGTATVTVKGINRYTGTIRKTFVVKPRPVAVSEMSKGAHSITVRWNSPCLSGQLPEFRGYIIKYSTRSDMAGAEVIKVKNAYASSYKIRGLESSKKYYVQLRTYKVLNGKVYISKSLGTKYVRTNTQMVIPEEYEPLINIGGKTWNEMDLNDDEYRGFIVNLKGDLGEEFFQEVQNRIENIGDSAKIDYIFQGTFYVSSLDLISIIVNDPSVIDYIEPDLTIRL